MEENKIKDDKQIVNIKTKEKKIIEHKDYVEKDGKKYLHEPDEEFEVRSCCGSFCSIDKSLLEFFSKTIVSLSVLGFCFIQLSNGQQSEFASSTISLILGTYLGSHASSSSSNNKEEKKK